MPFNYQIITTPTVDTPGTTVLLHFPDKRYLFGQPSEGTQRACTERGVKFTNLTDVFVSGRLEWSNTGGLIGVILTQADALASTASAQELAAREKEARRQKNSGQKSPDGKSKAENIQMEQDKAEAQEMGEQGTLTIHGGRNIAHMLATTRRFVFRKGMPVFTKEYDSESMPRRKGLVSEDDPCAEPSWSDSNIKVWAMPITPSTEPQGGQRSPRKRSLDEFQETSQPPSPADMNVHKQILRQSVVADMFNSSWRIDALAETRLAEVKMPAIMFVRNPETKDLERYTGPAPGSNEPLPDITVLVRKPWPGAAVEKIPATTKSNEALSYIIRSHDTRGVFETSKARALNVKPGPNYGLLARGVSVMSEDGKEVTSEMVLGPTRLGNGMAVIDLPTPDYVDNLLNRPEWKSPSVTTNLKAVLWILGPGVGDHPKLREFVKTMPSCEHLVASPDYCPNYLSMRSIAQSSIRMAKLRPDNFPVPFHDNTPPYLKRLGSAKTSDILPFRPAEPNLRINMAPEFGFNESGLITRLNTAAVVKKIPSAAQKRAVMIDHRLNKPYFRGQLQKYLKNLPGANAEIYALGTGSSSPSKYRNVSSTLIRVPGYGYYLLDCGENTLGQLKRMFEPEALREVLQNLRMIWISHLHADHHLGTTSVIKAWYQENYPEGIPQSELDNIEMDMSKILQDKRLFIVSEEFMVQWLEEYSSVEDFGFGKVVPLAAHPQVDGDSIKTHFVYRHTRSDGTYPDYDLEYSKPVTTELRFTDSDSPLTALLQKATGLSDLLTTKVAHCRGAMAVSLVFPSGFKVSFSGDCRPSPTFAAIGKGSTILIHEATFQDDMQGSAIAKKHSTTTEAIEVGRKMQARSILLTHFSQRYQKVALVDQKTAPKSQESYKKENAAASQERTTDIPIDNDGADEDLTTDVSMSLEPNAEENDKAPAVVPIVAAYDYMCVKVKDMFAMAAHAPALEKLQTLLERAAEHEAKVYRLKREAQEAERQAKDPKNKKKKKNEGKGASPPPPTTGAAVDSDAVQPPQPPESVSVWSASDSESGWTNTDVESESGSDRARSPKPRRQRQWFRTA